MFAPFRTGRSNLLWRGVFLVLLVQATLASSNTLGTASEAQDDLDEKIVQDLKSERVKFSFRMMKSRLVVLVSHAPVGGFMDEEGWSTVDPPGPTTTPSPYDFVVPALDDYYVYDMPYSAFTPTGKLYLHGGVLFKDKWLSLHDWLVNPANSFKSEPGDWLQDYAYMFVSDEQQHEYLRVVMIERPTSGYHRYNVADNFLIDKTGGSSEQVKNMTAHLTEELKVMICSNEPMSFYYLNMQDGDSRQTISYRQGDSSQGDPRRDFALGKRAFNGSTSLSEATGFTDVGKIYAICKSGENEIVTQEAGAQLCNEPVDWDIRLGFVDSADRMVLLDEHMTMRSFHRSAITSDGVGKPVKVETVKRGQFFERSLPPSDSNILSRGDYATNFIIFFSLIIIGRAQSIQFLHRYLLCLSAVILLMHSASASNNTTSSTASSSPIDNDSDEYEDATKLGVKKSNKIIFIIAIPVIIIFFSACILTEYYFGITFVYVQFCVRQNERKAKKKNNKKFIKKDRKENEELKTDGSLALQTIGGTTGSTSIESSAIARKRRDSE